MRHAILATYVPPYYGIRYEMPFLDPDDWPTIWQNPATFFCNVPRTDRVTAEREPWRTRQICSPLSYLESRYVEEKQQAHPRHLSIESSFWRKFPLFAASAIRSSNVYVLDRISFDLRLDLVIVLDHSRTKSTRVRLPVSGGGRIIKLEDLTSMQEVSHQTIYD